MLHQKQSAPYRVLMLSGKFLRCFYAVFESVARVFTNRYSRHDSWGVWLRLKLK